LANSHANFQIVARVRALRDFFIILFFVFLGTQMVFQNVIQTIWPAIILLLVVILYKPLIIITSMGILGYRRRTSFLTGVTLAQVSEFSLIVVFLGNKLGHTSDTVVSLVTIVAVSSFVISNYLISSANALYKLLFVYLEVFERQVPHKEHIGTVKEYKNHVILVGANRMEGSILKTFEKKGEYVIVVDFDPDVVKTIKEKEGITSIFGDISDVEIQERARLSYAKLIISTVPDVEDNLILLQSLKGKKAKIVMVAQNNDEAKRLYAGGADYVVLPHLVGGRHIANMLRGDNIDVIDDFKAKDELFF
jgi:voltage-gated potassium channel Kch